MEMLKRPDKIPSMFIQQEIARRRQMRLAQQAEMSKNQPMTSQMQNNQQNSPPIGMNQGGSPYGNVPYTGATVPSSFYNYPYEELIQAGYVPQNLQEDERITDMGRFTPPEIRKILKEDFLKTSKQVPLKGFEYIQLPPEDVRRRTDPTGIKSVANATTQQYSEDDYESDSGIVSGQKIRMTSKEAMDGIYPEGIGNANVDTSVTLPDNTAMNETIKNLSEQVTKNISESKNLIGEQKEGIMKMQTKQEEELDLHKKYLKSTQEKKSKLFNTDELKSLYDNANAHYDKAIEFIENDKRIVDAQQNLLEAMKDKSTPAQKFFGYVAQIGADIMGSDRETFLAAGGEAISNALKDFKFANEKAKQNFVDQAKLMIEFEQAKRENKMKAFEMKSQLYGKKIDQFNNLREVSIAEVNDEMAYNTGIFQLNQDQQNNRMNFQNMLTKGNLALMELSNQEQQTLFDIASFQNEQQQQKFANDLALANNALDRERIKLAYIPNSVKEFMFAENLTEPARERYLASISTATKSGASPDVTARGLASAELKIIADNGNDQKAAIDTLGEALYNKVKNPNGSVNAAALYQHYYFSVGSTMMGLSGDQQSVIDYKDL